MAGSMDLTDAIVVITGAGSGMGRAYALEAAARGARLALNDYDAAALDETVALLGPDVDVLASPYDVSDRAATFAFAARVEGDVKPFWATDDDAYERVMAINFYGVLHGTRAFLPQLLTHDDAAVVNVSSIFGLVGTPNHSDYCASKFAVRGFTEALSAELLHTGVAVHLVHPGGIATNIARQERSQAFASKYFGTSPDAIARVVLDALGTRKTRIVYGHGARKTWLGARILPQRLMARLVWRDLSDVIDRSDYPAAPTAISAESA